MIEALRVMASMLDDDTYDQSDPGDDNDEFRNQVNMIIGKLGGHDLQSPRTMDGRKRSNGHNGGEQCPVCFKYLPRNCELKLVMPTKCHIPPTHAE